MPAIVMPLMDPTGVMFPHLRAITPLLKSLFESAYVDVPPSTRRAQPEHIAWLEADPFFRTLRHEADLPAGEDFRALYEFAARLAPGEQILHLCFIDRVAFALETDHRAAFAADIQATGADSVPLIFHRSEAAWETHPRSYRQLEQMVTTAGELLFNRTLDFAWCHLAIRAGQLGAIAARLTRPDISVVGEIVLAQVDQWRTREVDWLAWEDPFILGRDPDALKQARERSPDEVRKRLGYVIPMLQMMLEASAVMKQTCASPSGP